MATLGKSYVYRNGRGTLNFLCNDSHDEKELEISIAEPLRPLCFNLSTDAVWFGRETHSQTLEVRFRLRLRARLVLRPVLFVLPPVLSLPL